MKKFLAIFLFLLFLTTPILATNAEEVNSDSVTLLESTENIQKLKTFKAYQNFSGDFRIKGGTYSPEYTGQFQVGITSDIFNHDAYENDAYAQIRGRANIYAKGTNKPFDNLIINFRGELKTLFGDGLYMRLQQLDMKAIGIPLDELRNYQEFKKDMENEVAKFKEKWIYLPENFYENKLDEGVSQEVFEEEVRKKLNKDGIKETYKELARWYLETMSTGLMDAEETKKMNRIIDQFSETDFFTRKVVTSGYYKDFTRFFLSKRRIINFMQYAAGEMGEDVDPIALEEFKTALSKFYLSGMHHTHETHRIFDQFKLKFILHDLEKLDKLHLEYFLKITDINKGGSIQKPDNFTHMEDLLDELFPNSYQGTNYEIEPTVYVKREVSIDDDAMKGDVNAPVTIIEFTDFQCPFCARFHNDIFSQIDSEYIKTGKVRFVVRDFPLMFHEDAHSAAMAAECVREQGGDEFYFDYIDKLYNNQSSLSNLNLKLLARDLGINEGQFNECLDSEKYAEEVNKDVESAKEYSVVGVPAFFINGHKISGSQPFSSFKTIIDEELNN